MAPTNKTAGAAGSDKKTVKRGPQKRVFHIFYRTGADGNLEIANVLTDARKVVDFIDTPEYASQGLKRFKYEVTSQTKDDGTEDHSGAAVADDAAQG